MHTKVKICGITQLKEIEFINKTDIDYIGFVFAQSKRKVNTAQARILADALKDEIKSVGVFVSHSVDEINDIADEVGLDIVQVHKNYDAEMIKKIHRPVWYAVSIKDKISIREANRAAKYNNVEGVVTDTYVKGMEGGTGKTFNWKLLEEIDYDVTLILAGGLTPHNIDKAIYTVNPNIVDVSSGVEKEYDGITRKSQAKIIELLRKVRTC